MSGTPTTSFASVLLDPAASKISPVVVEAKIRQADRSHDIAVLRIRGVDPTKEVFATGTPVQISYGWNPSDTEVFYGYVNHVEPEYDYHHHPSLPAMYSTLVCMGTSYGMRDASSAAYPNAQVSSLVESIVVKYRLAGVIEVGDPVWPQLSNPGISDWKFLVKLAAKLGWCLAVNKTTLRMYSLEKIVQRYATTIPTFWTRSSAPNSAYIKLSSFKVMQGETTHVGQHSKAIRLTGNVDRELGTFYNQTTPVDPLLADHSSPALFHVYETEAPATDSGVAVNSLAGLQRDNRFYIQAEAVVAGNTKVVQGSLVLLLGLGSLHQGLWYVESVEHHITSENYVSRLMLGRDGLLDNGLRPARPPDQVTGISDTTALDPPSPPTTLISNGWRSAYKMVMEI